LQGLRIEAEDILDFRLRILDFMKIQINPKSKIQNQKLKKQQTRNKKQFIWYK